MKLTRLAILGFLAFLAPLCSYAKHPHSQVAMSTQKMHVRRLNKSHAGPYGFGGKLSKSRDHKYHPVKQR
jgi:hypothetical protein